MKNNYVTRKDKIKSKRLAPANYLIVCEGGRQEECQEEGEKG